MSSTTPPHRDPRLLGLVFAGGAVGSVARYAVWLAMPRPDGWPLGTLAVNILGAFLLGWLLSALASRGSETPARRRIRLGVGTGVLGGFTTYSSFALEIERLFVDGSPAVAFGYVAVTLFVGTTAAFLGVALGNRSTPPSEAAA